MADHIDRASDLTQRMLDISLSKVTKFEGVSLMECDECGDDIPAERRKAIPGVKLCVFCQELKEKAQRNHR